MKSSNHPEKTTHTCRLASYRESCRVEGSYQWRRTYTKGNIRTACQWLELSHLQSGPRSTGQDATGQFTLLVMLGIGMDIELGENLASITRGDIPQGQVIPIDQGNLKSEIE